MTSRGGAASESSACIRAGVLKARELQCQRFSGAKERSTPMRAKGHSPDSDLLRLGADAEKLLERVMQQQGLTAAPTTRILKVARTIADLEGRAQLNVSHIAEAIQYRTLDRS